MAHTWKFFRAGGFDQVKLESGSDLANLDQLDQKLWVALACPARGLEFDNRTLDIIDTDKDGRIRAPEIIAAAKWTTGLLKNPDDLIKGLTSLPLASINDATPDGKQILASAKQILINLGKPDAATIELAEAMDTVKIFAATTFNGDGIITADAAEDDATKAVIADIMACMGIENDRSGKPGVSQPKTDAFFIEAQAHSDWWKRSEGDQTILPLGEATATAAAADAASTAKLQDTAAVTAGTAPAKPADPKKMDLGTIALLTTAFTAIAGIVTTILAKLTGIFALGVYAIPALAGVFLGIILLISGPSMILAYMKLRKRNLGPLLDANGWAVNSKAKVNVPFGRSLTQVAELPHGSQRDLVDPFASQRFPWAKIVILVLALAAIYFILLSYGIRLF